MSETDDTAPINGGPARCTAKSKRSGKRCKGPAVSGGSTCRMHGGTAAVGYAAPGYKHGRYSRHLPPSLAELYARADADAELVDLRADLVLATARVEDGLSRLSRDGGDRVGDRAVWQDIRDALGDRRRIIESMMKRDRELGETITAERLWLLIDQLIDILRTHVADPDTFRAIAADVGRLLGPPPKGEA